MSQSGSAESRQGQHSSNISTGSEFPPASQSPEIDALSQTNPAPTSLPHETSYSDNLSEYESSPNLSEISFQEIPSENEMAQFNSPDTNGPENVTECDSLSELSFQEVSVASPSSPELLQGSIFPDSDSLVDPSVTLNSSQTTSPSISCMADQKESKKGSFTPLYEGAMISLCAAMCAIMKFSTRNKLTYKAMSDLLQLLHILLPTPSLLPQSFYKFKKFFHQFSQQHDYTSLCSKCGQTSCSTDSCGDTAHVVHLNIQNQLEKTLHGKLAS